jgi:hypothetical protein
VVAGRADGVPGLTDLPGDQIVELVAPVGRGCQPEPATGRDLPDGVGERRRWDMVAFVGDHQAIPGGQLGNVSAPGQGLQRGDVDPAAEPGPSAAELTGFHAEEVTDPGAPLVGQGLAVHQDKGRGAVRGDHGARDDCLARSGRRDEDYQYWQPR